MGYCHVAQPVYLAAGDLKDALVSITMALLLFFSIFFCEFDLKVIRDAYAKIFNLTYLFGQGRKKREIPKITLKYDGDNHP